MITKAIEKAYNNLKRKGWEKTYWAFDIHETIIKPNWQAGNIPTEYYPLAKEALKVIGQRKEVVKILYTCSHPYEIVEYVKFFAESDIHFDFVNENPEVLNSGFGCYDKKPYFNVLFEDKSGFDPYEDWGNVLELMNKLN